MRRVAIHFALAATLLLGAEARAQVASPAAEPSEHLIKAGFVYNFVKLVEWPAAAWGQPGSPIVIGVLGSDTFADVMEGVVSGKRIDGRPFLVRRLKWKEIRDFNIHILFISSQESARPEEIVQATRTLPVLTIAETADFARRGGIMNFTLKDSRVGFDVNVDAARQASINISSRLLSLARIVQTSSSVR